MNANQVATDQGEILQSFMAMGMAYSDLSVIRDLACRIVSCDGLDVRDSEAIQDIAATANRLIRKILNRADELKLKARSM